MVSLVRCVCWGMALLPDIEGSDSAFQAHPGSAESRYHLHEFIYIPTPMKMRARITF